MPDPFIVSKFRLINLNGFIGKAIDVHRIIEENELEYLFLVEMHILPGEQSVVSGAIADCRFEPIVVGPQRVQWRRNGVMVLRTHYAKLQHHFLEDGLQGMWTAVMIGDVIFLLS